MILKVCFWFGVICILYGTVIMVSILIHDEVVRHVTVGFIGILTGFSAKALYRKIFN